MEFSKEELKEIVISSYELLIRIPQPQLKEGKYELSSRNKFKTLPEALREIPDESASITHFVKTASYFLPRAERGGKDDKAMLPFLDLLLSKVKEIGDKESDPERRIEKIKYLIGYTNWNADSVITIFNAFKNDDNEIRKRLQTMLGAELGIIGARMMLKKSSLIL